MSRYASREEYDAVKNSFPPEYQYQWYPPPLYLARWKELPGILLYYLAGAVVTFALLIGLLLLLGAMGDGISRYNSEHRRCLQNATNGYEIEQCR